MIVMLEIGETLDYKACQSGISKKMIIEHNGFEPICGNAFSLPMVSSVYTVACEDTPMRISKKIGLKIEEIIERCGGEFCPGKMFYY